MPHPTPCTRLFGTGRSRARAMCLFRAALPVAALLLCGCELPPEMAEKESVLAPLFSQPTEFDAVLWANDEYDADKRARGTALLAYSPNGDDPKYVNYLYRRYLTDPESNVRAVAAYALALHGTPEHVPEIVPLLKDKNKHVRKNAARALQRLHNTAAVPPLIDALDETKEPEWDVRAEAADALGQYAETRVLDWLIAALDDDHLIVNQAALRSLKTLTGQAIGVDRRAWTAWLRTSKDQFAGQTAYIYPAYSRDKFWLEYLPFMRSPPNEIAASPVGMPPIR